MGVTLTIVVVLAVVLAAVVSLVAFRRRFAQILRGPGPVAQQMQSPPHRFVPKLLFPLVRSLQSCGHMTKSPKRILVATDLSEGSDEALGAAIDLATSTGAELELLYVLEIEVEQFPFGFSSRGDSGGLVTYVNRELSQRADLAAKAGLRCLTRMVEGSAATEIVQQARNSAADMIVVGTHGRRGLAHVFLGSVAEKVVQRATCPVLTIPFSKKAA